MKKFRFKCCIVENAFTLTKVMEFYCYHNRAVIVLGVR